MSNVAQIAANQANAKLSTGPKTEEGKAASSVNAVRTALTGRTVLLPADDVEAYQKHVARFDAYQRQLNNLSLQQERLGRHFFKGGAELEKLIRDREAQRKADMAVPSAIYATLKPKGCRSIPAKLGLIFQPQNYSPITTQINQINQGAYSRVLIRTEKPKSMGI